MAGPIGPTGPCPHGVVDDICEPCTLRNHLVTLVELCDALEVVGYQVEDAREIVLHKAVQAPVPVCPDNVDGHEYRDITQHQHTHTIDWCVHCGDVVLRHREGTVPMPRYLVLSKDHPIRQAMDSVVKVLGHMIAGHYMTDEGIVGGLLHVQLDDENLEDCFWEDPFSPEVQDIWERPPTQLERDIAGLMQALPLEYREAAIKDAKERGTWGQNGS